MSITIVSGCPGTGKTALASRLSRDSSRGLHLLADRFFDFIEHVIPPVLPESHAQNTTVSAAAARAAGAFAEGGYEVFVDGVVGPWFLPVFARELDGLGLPVDYVVVRAPLEETLRRATDRCDAEKFDEAGVRQMHAAFANLGEFEAHAVDTGGRTPDASLAEIARRRAGGEFRLDLARIARGVLALLLVLAFAFPVRAQEQPVIQPAFHGLYLLTFNRRGELVNPLERALAIQELRANPRVERIIVFSYGWANEGEASYETYVDLLGEITARAPRRAPPGSTAVIAVGWDSSQTGLRKLLNDLLPFPVIADALAFVPDTLLFPVSFWSKAGHADRIGYGGLRTSLNEIFTAVYPDPAQRPDVYLVGHSFGTRILSGLMKNQLLGMRVRGEEFVAADSVKGAVFLQPALVQPNLHDTAGYPLMITQSSHDHANGFLYPVANSFINAYSFTAFEALFETRVLSPIQSTIGTTVGTMTDVVTAPIPGRQRDPGAPDPDDPERQEAERPTLRGRTASLLRRGLAELLSVPATVVFTLVALPVNYAYVQTHGLLTRPVDHVMDTLAQLPVVEVPVWALDRALGHEIPWGRLSKGFLSLGALHEASGHASAAGILDRSVYPVYGVAQIDAFAASAEGCGLPQCEGVFGVEASPVVHQGSFGNLERPLVDFTVGWLDLVGAHGDYRNAEVVRLMSLVLWSGSRETPAER